MGFSKTQRLTGLILLICMFGNGCASLQRAVGGGSGDDCSAPATLDNHYICVAGRWQEMGRDNDSSRLFYRPGL